MNGAGLFFLLLFLLVIIPAAGFIGFTRWSAHKRGLPPPPLSAYNPLKYLKRNRSGSANYSGGSGSGPLSWVKDKFSAMRDHRAGSGYAGQTRGARGFGPLDPDAAWDDRVGLEADGVDMDGYGHYNDGHRGGGGDRAGAAGYEEQQLGGIPRQTTGATDHGPYGLHSGHQDAMPAYGDERGRTRSREDLSYHGAHTIPPQELDARYDAVTGHKDHGAATPLRGVSPRPAESPSPKFERRSVFRENV